MNFLTFVVDGVLGLGLWEQQKHDEGFDDGVNGRPPRVTFGAPNAAHYYTKGYECGQKAALVRLTSAATKKISE